MKGFETYCNEDSTPDKLEQSIRLIIAGLEKPIVDAVTESFNLSKEESVNFEWTAVSDFFFDLLSDTNNRKKLRKVIGNELRDLKQSMDRQIDPR